MSEVKSESEIKLETKEDESISKQLDAPNVAFKSDESYRINDAIAPENIVDHATAKAAETHLQEQTLQPDPKPTNVEQDSSSEPEERYRTTEDSPEFKSEIDKIAQELTENSQANEQFTEELVSITELLETSAPELTQGGLSRGPKLSQKVSMSKKAALQASQKMEKELLINHAKGKSIEALKEHNQQLDLNRNFGDMVRKPRNAAEYTAVKVAQTHLSPTQFRDVVTNKQKSVGAVLNMAQANMISKVNTLQQSQKQSSKQHTTAAEHQPKSHFLSEKVGILSSIQSGLKEMLSNKPNALGHASKGGLGTMRAQSTPSAAKAAEAPAMGMQLKK